jgi:deoxyribodipyrimidine photo-lyase
MRTITNAIFADATRKGGLEKVERFLPAAGRLYAQGRNFDHGRQDRHNVSALSPYLRHRLITERELLDGVLSCHSPTAAEKFIQEVFWRGYFKGYLEAHPQIWRRYCGARDHLIQSLAVDAPLAKRYQRAVSGMTGIDCFDAWVEELVETGYLHNHARMWFASIWIFTLKLPWELGADFTYRHFLDGDPASNTLSWRWVGGLHTRGKTYLARAANIREYTNGRFDPKGLAADAIALEEQVFEPGHKVGRERTPAPTGPALYLLTEEDLHPETLVCGTSEIRAVIGTHDVLGRSPLAVSDPVRGFTEAALADGLSRATTHFKTEPAQRIDLSAPSLIRLARQHEVSRLVTAYAPVGPINDRLASLKPLLAEEEIALTFIDRPEDLAIWPHATKGFFKVKEQIPRLLRDLGIGAALSDQGDLFQTPTPRTKAHR